jgi:outer membrane protein assembly factor BamD
MLSGIFSLRRALLAICSLGLLASCVHKKYDTPITKNTQQPDKVLFDQAMHDIEHGRYEVARISLQTLMNTYESSEYMAKAKLAVADSWFREGGANGLAQAEAEYKDFILFYPAMEESAEAQNRVCEIHYNQMDKSDRDWTQTLRAETECKDLLLQFPNSKFAPQAAQRLRSIQESLAEHEFVVGNFYWKREMNPAAANRLSALVDQFPLYSRADEALFEAGDSYAKMGPRFRKQSGEMFARIVRDYPTTARVDDATKRLQDMELPVPAADGRALARMKYEHENYRRPGMFARTTSWMRSSPDMSRAAKQGSPTMTDPRRTIPASIPVPVNTEASGSEAGGSAVGTTEVTASTPGANSALDTKPDARSAEGSAAAGAQSTATAQAPTQAQAPLPTNRDKELQRIAKERARKQAAIDKKNKKKKGSDETQPAAPAAGAMPNQAPVGTQAAPNQIAQPSVATNPANQTTVAPTNPVGPQ